ncbi:adenosine A2 receptor [Sarcoptes scabiei]|nr:adenosine A2 receptor [Sarcoptes scabiei]
MTELKLSKSKFKDRHKHETISLQDSDDNNSNADPNDFYDNNRANTNDLRRSNQINHDKSKSLINAVMPLGIRRTRKRSSQISQQISMALQQTRSTLKSFSSFDRSISLSDGFDQSISDQSSTIDSIRYNMKRSKPFFRRILCGRYRNKVKNDSFDDDQFMKTTVISNNDNGRNYSRKPYESDGNQMNGQCKGSPYSINHYCNNNQTKSNDSIGIQATKLSYSRREVKKAQKLFVIVVFFMICWIPLYTSNAVQAICRRCPTLSANLLDYLIILSHINSAGSPFLYAFHMKDFRQALRRLICKGAVNRRKLRDLRREELFSISGQRMYSIVSKNLNELNHLDPSMTDGPQQNDRYDRFERKRKSFHESIDRLPSSKINTKIISRNQNAIDSNRNNRDIKLTLPKSDSNFQRYF